MCRIHDNLEQFLLTPHGAWLYIGCFTLPDYWQSYLLQLQGCHNSRASLHLRRQSLIPPGCLRLLPPLLQPWGTLTLAHGLLLTQHGESAAGPVCQSLAGHDVTLLWAHLLHESASSPWSGSSPPSWWHLCLGSRVPTGTPQVNKSPPKVSSQPFYFAQWWLWVLLCLMEPFLSTLPSNV